MNRRPAILLTVLYVFLALAAGWSYQRLATSAADAEGARADMAACRDIGAQIEQLSSGPTVATEHEKLAAETVSLVEQAARAAGIPSDGISGFSPEQPRRIEESPYKEQSTQIVFRRINLEQLVRLTYGVISQDPGLYVKSIHLTAPRQEEGQMWTVELTLSYLIYDPIQIKR